MQRNKVLVVDDEPIVRSVASAMLEDAGFETLVAADGEEAERLFTEQADEIGAVLLDLTMPAPDGRETLKRLRALRPGVPTILSSGYADFDAAEDFPGTGHTDFLQKPYSADALAEKVRAALESA